MQFLLPAGVAGQPVRSYLLLKLIGPMSRPVQVWLDNPAEYFAQFPEADVLVSSDALNTQLQPGDPGLELPHAAHTAMNIGAPYRISMAPMLHALSCVFVTCASIESDLAKLIELPGRLPARCKLWPPD